MTTPASESVVRVHCLAVMALPHDRLEVGSGGIEAVILAALLALACVALNKLPVVVLASHLRERGAGLT